MHLTIDWSENGILVRHPGVNWIQTQFYTAEQMKTTIDRVELKLLLEAFKCLVLKSSVPKSFLTNSNAKIFTRDPKHCSTLD